MAKIDKISQIVRLKELILRWKQVSICRRRVLSYTDSETDFSYTNRPVPSGFLAVYVGPERRRFVIPSRFLNLPVFVGLLKMAAEEYGFKFRGGLTLPCDVEFFREILMFLERDEKRFSKFGLDEFFKMISEAEVGFESCKELSNNGGSSHCRTPLLPKARV